MPCPECSWDGEVAVTHDRSHKYYTHVIVKNGETFTGRTCSTRTRPKKGPVSNFIKIFK